MNMKQRRYCLLAASVAAYLAAVGIVCNRGIHTVLANIVTENLGTVLGTYSQIAALIGAVCAGLVPCALLLAAASAYDGRMKKGLALLGAGCGLDGIAVFFIFLAGTADTAYLTNCIVAAVCGLLALAGDLFLAADNRNRGIVRGIIIAAASFALLTMLAKIGTNALAMQLFAAALGSDAVVDHQSYVTAMSLLSAVQMFLSIIAAVLTGSKYMLLYTQEPTESKEP